MNKKFENQYGIKIGDVFYSDRRCGVHGHFIQFYQVVALEKENKIVIKEIDSKAVSIKDEEKFKIYNVIPIKNKFKDESNFIKDNNIGTTKLIQKGLGSNKDIIYITIDRINYHDTNRESITIYAYLWDGTPKEHFSDLFKYINENKI